VALALAEVIWDISDQRVLSLLGAVYRMKPMATWQPDRGEWMAIALGLAVAVALAWLLFGLVGWLGVGLVGLIGLVISGRVALDDGRAVPDSDFGSTGVGIVARQMEEEHRIPSEQRAARWAEQEKRSAILYFVNTIGIALAALGFTLFVVHQL
jgi:hypothetical protein